MLILRRSNWRWIPTASHAFYLSMLCKKTGYQIHWGYWTLMFYIHTERRSPESYKDGYDRIFNELQQYYNKKE
jgi:hypothetical protein